MYVETGTRICYCSSTTDGWIQLYVSNTSTTPHHGYDLCYQDPAGYPYPALTQTISCNQL